jgi:hypothetical protein
MNAQKRKLDYSASESYLKGIAQYSRPPHEGSLVCDKGKRYFQYKKQLI